MAPFPRTTVRGWNLPPRNPNFTGRAENLATLARTLDGQSTVTVGAVHGMGGVGKTQLVNEYAHTHATKYEVVWWIAAETTETIPDQFATLATQLGAEPDADPDAIRTAVHEQLRQVHGWLLVFDNANSVADLRNWIPTSPLSTGVPGHVVVTTRRSGFKGLGTVLDLDVFELEAAVALIRIRVPDVDVDVATAIAESLGRLPLALEQAAAYLDKTGMPAPEYLTLLQTRTEELISRGLVADRADTTVATLWDLSLEQIAPDFPAAVQLLDLCAYLAPEAIPLDLFTHHPELLPSPLSRAVVDPVEFADALAVLADFSLAKRTTSGLQIHRLVQAAIRAKHRHRDQAMIGIPSPSPLATVLTLLRADAPRQILGAPQAWPRWAVLLPHVLAATGLHLASPPAEQSRGARQTWWLMDRAGTYLQIHGRAPEGRPLLERALTLAEATYGPDHPSVAGCLNNLVSVLYDLGELATACPLAERALILHQAIYGSDHPSVAISLNNLASVLYALGDLAAARPLAEQALAITEATYGPDHPSVATRLINLAAMLRDLGDLAAARPLAERALAISEATYGPDHPSVAISLSNLASGLLALGELAAARPLAERALAITEATYGPNHPSVATRLINLAAMLRDQGQPAAARPLLERALAITQSTYSPDHPSVVTPLVDLAAVLRDLGRPAAARPLLERALAINEVIYGRDHPRVATPLVGLAWVLHDLGQLPAARQLLTRALAITEPPRGQIGESPAPRP